jgi:nucleoside-diphosphate-sugar epimerase
VTWQEHPLARDLDEILEHTDGLWHDLRGARIFVTGGTGFFGAWLLESFAWANRRHGLGAEAVVLSRDPAAAARRHPGLARAAGLHWHKGDIRSFEFPGGEFSHVIHAAADATRVNSGTEPIEMVSTILDGTRRVLEFTRIRGIKRLLFTSSGAVYGRQPPELQFIEETFAGAPDSMAPPSAYGESKRAAELLCALHGKSHGTESVVARGFAFVGPHLALDAAYAVGNFIRDGLRGGPIRVESDGTAWRSYLYAADMAAWLWTMLLRGVPCRPYNLGSEHAVTIAELANRVAGASGPTVAVQLAKTPTPGALGERYVPSVARARLELGLAVWTDLPEAIRRTLGWHRQANGLG